MAVSPGPQGREGSRPTALTPEKLQIARQMYESQDDNVATIARVVGVSRKSFHRGLAQPQVVRYSGYRSRGTTTA